MKLISLLVIAATANAFVVQRTTTRSRALSSTIEDDSTVEQYLERAEERKLLIMQALEERKQAEISALRAELAELQAAKAREEEKARQAEIEHERAALAARLVGLQEFLLDYVQRSEEEKIKAVRAAELAVAKEYDDKYSQEKGQTNDRVYLGVNGAVAGRKRAPQKEDKESLIQAVERMILGKPKNSAEKKAKNGKMQKVENKKTDGSLKL